jgi:hypothetical protein
MLQTEAINGRDNRVNTLERFGELSLGRVGHICGHNLQAALLELLDLGL